VSALLLFGNTVIDRDLRHQVPVEIHDPLLYFERDGTRTVVTTVLEQPRVSAAGDYEILLLEQLGRDAFARELGSRAAGERRAMLTALGRAGVTAASVPSSFPLGYARELEAAGVALSVDDDRFARLRRRKTARELEGIRRAQAAADAVVDMLKKRLSEAERRDGRLYHDGRPMAVGELKTAIRAELAAHDAALDEFILSHGANTAIGHDTGDGVLAAGEAILLDFWPTDRASACCTDMTRTFVVGAPPAWLAERHALCLEALDAVLRAVRPGAACAELHGIACDVFEAHGHPTVRTAREDGEVLVDGFPYPLGHGVGLALHEAPVLRQGERSTLIEGDVIAIEPALYEQGVGGIRIEDVYVVTADGPERIGRQGHELVIA
jgi:Xaa-Pro aminopeptidase